jgi:hypothetical protein
VGGLCAVVEYYESALAGRSDREHSGQVRSIKEGPKNSPPPMAPVAINPPSDDVSTVSAPAKGPALVIGSLSTARDGKYQRIVSELEATRQVERQMLDRLLDRGNVFPFLRHCVLLIVCQ